MQIVSGLPYLWAIKPLSHMTTSITISSYVDTITDEQFREILDDATTGTNA